MSEYALATDQVQYVSFSTFASGDSHQALWVVGPNGNLYTTGFDVQTSTGAYQPFPAPNLTVSLRRIDTATGRVLYATYLPFFPIAMRVDRAGAIYLGGRDFAIAKLNPSGTSMEFVAHIGGSKRFSGAVNDIDIGTDGSIFLTGTTCSPDFPVTPDAYMPVSPSTGACNAVLTRLDSNASELLYSTYLGGTGRTDGWTVTTADDGMVYFCGTTTARDLPGAPAVNPIPDFGQDDRERRAFVLQFDSGASRVARISLFSAGIPTRIVTNKRGMIAVLGFDPGHALEIVPTAPWPLPDYSQFVMIFDAKLARLSCLGVSRASFRDILIDDTNALLVLGFEYGQRFPATTGAHLLTSRSGTFIANIDVGANRLVYSTFLDPPPDSMLLVERFRASANRVFVNLFPFKGSLFVGTPFEVTRAPQTRDCSLLQATPLLVQQCGAEPLSQTLLWDACISDTGPFEIRIDSPEGPVIARGSVGRVEIRPATTTYYLRNSITGRVLATESVGLQQSNRCAAVPRPAGQVTIFDNPILSCLNRPLVGASALVRGDFNDRSVPLELRVSDRSGPLFAFAPKNGHASGYAFGWVQDGLPFFLRRADTGDVLAMERAVLLPILDCNASQQPPQNLPFAALKANLRTIDACTRNRTATLAWYAGTHNLVEIRRHSADGPTLARFNTQQGLLEVTPPDTESYYLMAYLDGDWIALAAETIHVIGAGCLTH